MNSKLTGSGVDEAVVKKYIVIFTYKQWLLSIDMKTNVVQYDESSQLLFDIKTFLAGNQLSEL